MIKYDLICSNEHRFEGWFSSSDGFEAQRDSGILECPVCGTMEVDRALMAPSVSVKRDHARSAPIQSASEPQAQTQTFSTDPRAAALRQAMKELRDQVTQNAEYVGPRFAEEARKIHYQETEARGIYGEASLEDARSMADEGIEFHPLPSLPDDQN